MQYSVRPSSLSFPFFFSNSHLVAAKRPHSVSGILDPGRLQAIVDPGSLRLLQSPVYPGLLQSTIPPAHHCSGQRAVPQAMKRAQRAPSALHVSQASPPHLVCTVLRTSSWPPSLPRPRPPPPHRFRSFASTFPLASPTPPRSSNLAVSAYDDVDLVRGNYIYCSIWVCCFLFVCVVFIWAFCHAIDSFLLAGSPVAIAQRPSTPTPRCTTSTPRCPPTRHTPCWAHAVHTHSCPSKPAGPQTCRTQT